MPTRQQRLEAIASARPYVERAVRRYGGGTQTADIVQDVMLTACARVDTFRGEASVRVWLWRIAVNQTLKHDQRAASRKRREAHYGWWVDDEATCPYRSAEAGQRVALLRWQLSTMPRALRDVFLDRIEGLTFAAIAKRHRVCIGTAHRRASLALDYLSA